MNTNDSILVSNVPKIDFVQKVMQAYSILQSAG